MEELGIVDGIVLDPAPGRPNGATARHGTRAATGGRYMNICCCGLTRTGVSAEPEKEEKMKVYLSPSSAGERLRGPGRAPTNRHSATE